jgi:penicillin-binding protein 1A
LIYAAALERGYTPSTLITDLDTPVMTLQGAWVPDDGHSSASAMTMRAALRASSNRAAVHMLQEVGIDATVRYAERLGVGSVPNVPSLALGSGEVTLMSLTAAYSAFANAGMLPAPSLIRRVESAEGEVLFSAAPHSERAVSEATAFLMTNMLADVVNAGTAWQARRVGFRLPAAGKTGTTNDFRDAWFVGYTPRLAAGVWIGYDQPRTIIGNGYAGDLAVPFWGRFMMAATRDDPPDWFSPPATVTSATICRLSGRLATDDCRGAVAVDEEGHATVRSMVYTEYFVRGTEPVDDCPIHRYGSGEGFFDRVIGTIGTVLTGQPAPPPVSPESPLLPPSASQRQEAPQPAAAVSPLAPAQAEGSTVVPERGTPQPPRRNFWSRFLGRKPQSPPVDEPNEPARQNPR